MKRHSRSRLVATASLLALTGLALLPAVTGRAGQPPQRRRSEFMRQ
jgi:hypothetical protein